MASKEGKKVIRLRPRGAAERCAALKAALPDALRLLLERDQLPSLRAASRHIGETTGSTLTPMTLSLWTRGEAMPSFDSLVDFLVSLGRDLRDLATALEEVIARSEAETDRLAGAIADRLRADPALEQEMRRLLDQASTGRTNEPVGERRAMLSLVGRATDGASLDE